MRAGRFIKAMRAFSRQPVVSTPLIRNGFELGHCVSKPIKQGCLSPPSKQKEYFLIGLSASMNQCSLKPNFHIKTIPHMKASSSAVMIEPKEERETALEKAAEEQPPQPPREDSMQVSSSYWGITHNKPEKSWSSFMPAQGDISDASTDLTRHRTPENFLDQFARLTVMALRLPVDLFFRTRYFCRAAMLETIAAVPGMVGGILLHCKSLRRIEHSGGWIKALMEEAENERMHLMTFMELSKPSWQERALVFAVQGLFFNVYLLLYVISPRFAHRMVGYLGEETIQSYTDFIKDIDAGKIRNVPAPEVAIDYWRLPQDATLRDVVMVIRADKAHHRDMNHFAADVHLQGQQLKAAPVPICSLSFRRYDVAVAGARGHTNGDVDFLANTDYSTVSSLISYSFCGRVG